MNFKPSMNRNSSVLFATVIIMVMLVASYLFLYVPRNEKIITEQHFRTMQRIDNNVHDKISNSLALMNNLLEARLDKQNDVGAVNNYIAQFKSDMFTLSAIETVAIPLVKNSKPIAGSRLSDSLPDFNGRMLVDNSTHSFKLIAIKESEGLRYRMNLNYSFEQFIKPLLRANVFDEYIILSGGNVVYETFPSGLSYLKRDSLFNVRSGIFAATVKDLSIGGNDYKTFLQPVGFDEKNEWIICGLVKQRNFSKQAKQLPGDIVLILVMLTLIGIIVFPWIKLFFMGNSERLKLSDGFMSIIVAMLLTSMLFFMLFKYNTTARPDLGPESKKTLADAIEKNFMREIDTAYKQLCIFDTLQVVHPELKNNLINLNIKDSALKTGTNFIKGKSISEIKTSLTDSVKKLNQFKQLYQTFWLDKNGQELFRWSGTNDIPPSYNWKGRNYFKKIKSKDFYYLNKDDKKPFYLEQVISHAAGSFRTVLSKPSFDTKNIAAISFDVKSVKNALLPAGYTFVILNEAGDVLYHSDASRNLNENFIAECSDNEKLKAAISSHNQIAFTTGYYEKEYSVLVKPLNNLPYFIAVLSDLEFRETRDIEIFGFTLTMLFSFFIFLCVELGLILLVSGRRSKLKSQQIVTEWIWPRKSSHHAYVFTALFNFATMLLLLIYFNTCSFLEYLFILLYTSSHITLTINLIYYCGYQSAGENKYKFFKLKSVIVATMVSLFIIFIALTVYLKLSNYHFYTFVGLLILLTIITISAYKNYLIKISNKVEEPIKKKVLFFKLVSKLNYAQSFSLMALTRLIITSGIPVVLFYSASYNFEQNLNMRYKQVDFAKKLAVKFHNPQYNTLSGKMNFERFVPIYIDSSWINKIEFRNQPISPNSKSIKESTEEYLLSHLRFYKNELSYNNHNFYEKITSDSTIRFNNMTTEACMPHNSSITQFELPRNNKNPYLQLSGVPFNYIMPGLFNRQGIQFWMLTFLSMFAMAFVIYRVIKKIFAIDLPDLNEFKQFDEKVFFDSGLNKMLFVIGLPGSGKNQLVRSLFYFNGREADEELKNKPVMNFNDITPLILDFNHPENNNVFVSELFKIADSSNLQVEVYRWNKEVAELMNDKYKCIVLNHFEYNIKDVKANRVKLNLLENLMIDGKKKLIILSSLHPVAYLDSLYQNNQLSADERKMLDEDRERWNVLMGHFTNIFLPIKNYSKAGINAVTAKPFEYFGFWECIVKDVKSYFKEQTNESKIRQAQKEISSETQYTHQAQKLKTILKEIAVNKISENDDFDNDDVVLKVQTSMQHVYSYIWDSLTSEEKFILRDLAEDGLVNSYDSMNLCMLINKGIIIKEDSPMRIFNKSFRNYILTSISRAESTAIEKQIKDNGSWNTYKTPLLVVIFGVLAFLLSSQQETYNQVIGYVGTLAAGLPIIIKLLGLLESPGGKTAS